MTRINVAVPPKNLTDQHLLAEHREIKRICSLYINWKAKQTPIPDKFSLGKGHVRFFLDKGKYTHNRYKELYLECLNRGFNVLDYSDNWRVYSEKDYNGYKPSSEDKLLIFERIQNRIVESTQIPLYYGKKELKTISINRLIK